MKNTSSENDSFVPILLIFVYIMIGLSFNENILEDCAIAEVNAIIPQISRRQGEIEFDILLLS